MLFALVLPVLIVGASAISQSQKCQIVLDKFEFNAKAAIEHYNEQEYGKTVATNIILQQFLPHIEKYCPVFGEVDSLQFSTPFDCKTNVNRLTEILQEDVISNYPTLKQIINFQVDNCLPYDFAGGLDDLIKMAIKVMSNGDLQNLKGSGNPMECVGCTMIFALVNNYIDLKDINITDFIANKVLCQIFDFAKPIKKFCDNFLDVAGPILIKDLTNKENASVICNHLGSCKGYEQCTLYPGDSQKGKEEDNLQIKLAQEAIRSMNVGDILHDLINKFANDHLPILDWDNDRYSTSNVFRGYDWRGYDCEEFDPLIHPGRKTRTGKKGADYNCNDIKGVNGNTGVPYKEEYCDNTDQIGVVTIGDSAGAHFGLPGAWFNVSEWGPGTFSDMFHILADEGDLPYQSAGTGWYDKKYVSSFYRNLLEINRCNKNDYQNLGVNGARSTNEMHNMEALARHQQKDFPLFIFWELVGNDVCSPHPGRMTEPATFKQKILELWNKLDTMVPAGSHMVVTGLVDGRVLYNCLANRLQPIGVTYEVFYNYLNCLVISPCSGWMNSDPTVRNATTERAVELNQQYQDIIATTTFKNFDIVYYDFPIFEIFDKVEAEGGQCWDAIEPVDGFHPNQISQMYWSEILWGNIQKDKPHWIPPTNPNNQNIINQFGDSTYSRVSYDSLDSDNIEVIELQ